jgi:hypothetical protein
MPNDAEIIAGPEISEEFMQLEEFCTENVGQELAYLQLVSSNPLEMDPVTLAFCMRHLVRLSGELMDLILKSLDSDPPPDLSTVLKAKGIQLDKARAGNLRDIFFAFRDATDPEQSSKIVRALQLMTMGRERHRVVLSLGESYTPPEEGWTLEDFGGDELAMEAVRSVEQEAGPKFEEI